MACLISMLLFVLRQHSKSLYQAFAHKRGVLSLLTISGLAPSRNGASMTKPGLEISGGGTAHGGRQPIDALKIWAHLRPACFCVA